MDSWDCPRAAEVMGTSPDEFDNGVCACVCPVKVQVAVDEDVPVCRRVVERVIAIDCEIFVYVQIGPNCRADALTWISYDKIIEPLTCCVGDVHAGEKDDCTRLPVESSTTCSRFCPECGVGSTVEGCARQQTEALGHLHRCVRGKGRGAGATVANVHVREGRRINGGVVKEDYPAGTVIECTIIRPDSTHADTTAIAYESESAAAFNREVCINCENSMVCHAECSPILHSEVVQGSGIDVNSAGEGSRGYDYIVACCWHASGGPVCSNVPSVITTTRCPGPRHSDGFGGK